MCFTIWFSYHVILLKVSPHGNSQLVGNSACAVLVLTSGTRIVEAKRVQLKGNKRTFSTPCKTSSIAMLLSFKLNNRPFAWLGHMVQNSPSWMGNGAVGHKMLIPFFFLCSTEPFAIQHSRFFTMWPSHAKGLLPMKYLDFLAYTYSIYG